MLEICAFVVVQFRAELIADSLQLFVDSVVCMHCS